MLAKVAYTGFERASLIYMKHRESCSVCLWNGVRQQGDLYGCSSIVWLCHK